MANLERNTDDRFKQFFHQLSDAAVEFRLVDREPIIERANKAFCEKFGYEFESIVGNNLNDLIVPTGQEHAAKQFDSRTNRGKSNTAVVDRVTAAGYRTFAYRGVPIGDNRGFAIYTDITDQLQRERQLDVLQRVLRHNLRNDINVVLGMAEGIQEQSKVPHVCEKADKIKSKAEGLAQLSDESKIVDKVLRGQSSLFPVPLAPVINQSISTCQQRFESTNIKTHIHCNAVINADRRLKIVLDNLLDNAIRYDSSATPYVEITVRPVDDSLVLVEIADEGPGIPQAEVDIIIGEDDVTPLKHGSGLGLWLVKWVLESYGANLSINTTNSEGSIVSLYFNTAQSEGCEPTSK